MNIAVLRNNIRKPSILIPAVILIVAFIIDFMHLVKPSGLSALACTPILFQETSDAEQLVLLHRGVIIYQSEIYDLPNALVAAVIVDHQRQLTSYRKFTDCFGSALGANLSLGPAQIRMEIAANLDGRSLASLTSKEFRALRSKLLDPESNIFYETRELRALLERENRFPGISSSMLLNNPAALILVITEYRSGRMETFLAESRIGSNAVRTLNIMKGSTLSKFYDSEQDLISFRANIDQYLDDNVCEIRMYNRLCDRNGGILPPSADVGH